MSACRGCGATLEPEPVRRGPPRKWCSERCRKDSYAGTCEVCGGPTDGTTPSRGIAKVCKDCTTWTEAAVIDAMRRWAGEHGGVPPTVQDWQFARDGYPPATARVIRRIGWNQLLLRAGFALRCDRRPETHDWIVEQLQAGVSAGEIAEALGISAAAIYERFRWRGLKLADVRAGKVAA